MKDNKRKCFKCGALSGDDDETRLYRFPRPSLKNVERCQVWAKYCCPDKQWSSVQFHEKLYSEHRMLCHRHFEHTVFVDYSMKILQRNAIPGVQECYAQGLSESSLFGTPQPLANITNISKSTTHSYNNPGTSTSYKLQEEPILPGQIPLLNLDIVSSASRLSSGKTSSENMDFESSAFIQCKKYLKQICRLSTKIKSMNNKKILEELSSCKALNKLLKKISPTFAILLQAQIRNFKKSPKGRRWTSEDKITALRLYKRSPTCYRLLRRMFCLPAPSTLKVLLRQCELNVGINVNIEMSIKKHFEYNMKDDLIEGFQDHGVQGRSPQPASYALVFMIAGIRKKNKQPIAYYLSGPCVTADRLAVLIKEVLGKCQEHGINIAATVCDMDGVNRRAISILGATSNRPYFDFKGQEVVTLFDTPHLIKCFRNLFLKYPIECQTDISSIGTGIARWSHIVQFHELDNSSNQNFVFAPCLKEEHLNPNSRQKMKVKLAVQVLSHTVAAGMYAKISIGDLPSEAIITANLISKTDNLYDCLNSDTVDLRRGKPFSTNIKDSTEHIKFLREMAFFFKNMKFIGCARTPPSQEGWIYTINGIDRLWESLRRKHKNLKSLATRRLQQDPLENLFGCIRGNCGANYNPTSKQFVAGLKTAILSNLSHICRGNCEEDRNTNIIENFKLLMKAGQLEVPTEESFNNVVASQISSEIQLAEESSEIQACTYVCGYIIKKFEQNCELCMKIFTTEDRTTMHTFTQFKEYNELKESLSYASKNFVLCVEVCATEINNYLNNNANKKKLLHQIKNNLKETINFDFLNNCTEHKKINIDYIINSVFHITIKRFCTKRNKTFLNESAAISMKRKMNILTHK